MQGALHIKENIFLFFNILENIFQYILIIRIKQYIMIIVKEIKNHLLYIF